MINRDMMGDDMMGWEMLGRNVIDRDILDRDVDLHDRDMYEKEQLVVRENLAALLIGQDILTYLRRNGILKDALAAVNGKAVQILEEILRVLDDETLDDPTCFQRIEKIVHVMEINSLGSSRHDW